MTLPYERASTGLTPSANQALGRSASDYYIDLNGGLATTNIAQPLLYNVSAVDDEIDNVLLTPIGSEPKEPTFGSRIPSLRFEPFDIGTVREIKVEAQSALRQWLGSRLQTFFVSVTADYSNSAYVIRVDYTVKYGTQPGSYTRTLQTRS